MKLPRGRSQLDGETRTNYDGRSKRGGNDLYHETVRRLDFQAPVVTNRNDKKCFIPVNAPDGRSLHAREEVEVEENCKPIRR